MFSNHNKKGFTLIELLVVVLIIGILTAVALPQYQRAVEKSRATEAVINLRALSQALELYHMATGSYPPLNGEEFADGALDGLDVQVLPAKDFDFHSYYHVYFDYRRKNAPKYNYRLSQTFKSQSVPEWAARGLTCYIPDHSDVDTESARLCRDLCGVDALTQVWGSGEYGCEVK